MLWFTCDRTPTGSAGRVPVVPGPVPSAAGETLADAIGAAGWTVLDCVRIADLLVRSFLDTASAACLPAASRRTALTEPPPARWKLLPVLMLEAELPRAWA